MTGPAQFEGTGDWRVIVLADMNRVVELHGADVRRGAGGNLHVAVRDVEGALIWDTVIVDAQYQADETGTLVLCTLERADTLEGPFRVGPCLLVVDSPSGRGDPSVLPDRLGVKSRAAVFVEGEYPAPVDAPGWVRGSKGGPKGAGPGREGLVAGLQERAAAVAVAVETGDVVGASTLLTELLLDVYRVAHTHDIPVDTIVDEMQRARAVGGVVDVLGVLSAAGWALNP